MRRVVTGHDAQGRSVIVMDGASPNTAVMAKAGGLRITDDGQVILDGYGAGYSPGPRTYGTPAYIGRLLLTRFLLAFEIASFLLLIAAVGGVVLARRRRGLEGGDEGERREPAAPLRAGELGTMAEGVGRRA